MFRKYLNEAPIPSERSCFNTLVRWGTSCHCNGLLSSFTVNSTKHSMVFYLPDAVLGCLGQYLDAIGAINYFEQKTHHPSGFLQIHWNVQHFNARHFSASHVADVSIHGNKCLVGIWHESCTTLKRVWLVTQTCWAERTYISFRNFRYFQNLFLSHLLRRKYLIASYRVIA